MSIKAIIKKNLINAKRNIFKTILQLFYPCLFLVLVISITNSTDNGIDSRTYDEFINEVSLKDKDYPTLYNYENLAIIGNNNKLSSELLDYLLKSEGICNECDIKLFDTYKNFNKYLKSKEYINSTIIKTAIEYTEENNEINFNIYTFTLEYTSEYQDRNELNLIPQFNKLKNRNEITILQSVLTRFLIHNQRNEIKKNLLIKSIPLKTPKLISLDQDLLTDFLPSIFTISYISILFKFVLWLVVEKEKKLKDLLFRQGITSVQYFLSWLFTFLIMTIIPIIINTILMNIYFFPNTNIFLIFFILFLFSLNILSMSLVFHQFVNDVRSGQSLLKLIFVGVSILNIVILRDETSIIIKYLFCLFPQTLLKISLELLNQTKNFENGLSLSLFSAYYRGFNFIILVLLFILDFILYILVAYLIESFNHSGLNFLQFISKPFSKYKKVKNYNLINDTKNDTLLTKENNNKLFASHEDINDENLILQESSGECLKIKYINKSFDHLVAVNNFSCNLYKNQIFVLLGHNGAGKTTLLKIISGVEEKDKGEAFLDNINILTNQEYLFKNLGLCSQDDIIFEDLTVQEHLEIMSEIKGSKSNYNEIIELLTNIELIEKKDCLAKTLSGGQKRKLCIALALIGNSKLILLDEPTSGMDVTAKRALWKFLENYKKDKIIILTTHSLDEAEYLGDRIGIMSEGNLICSGSSSFLKNQYSCGFNINFIVDHEKITNNQKRKFVDELKKIDNKITIKVMGKELIVINIPEINQNCKYIFSTIETLSNDYNLINYTISTTSLEDVFLKLNSNELSKHLFDKEMKEDEIEVITHLETSYTSSISSEIKINIIRHILSLWRNMKSFVLEILACSLTFFIYVILFRTFLSFDKSTSLINLIDDNAIYYGNQSNIDYFNINDKIKFVSKQSKVDDIKDYDNYLFDEFPFHNIKKAFYLKKIDNTEINIYTYYAASSVDYIFVLNNLIYSSYLKNEFGIKSNLISKYGELSLGSKYDIYETTDKILIFMSNMLVISAFLNISSFMIITPLKEKILNIKHLQYLSGMRNISYWISILIVDILKFTILILIIFPFLLLQNINYLNILLIIIVFIISSCIFTYCFSFLFETEESGQKFYLLFTYMSMMILNIWVILKNPLYLTTDNFQFNIAQFFPSSALLLNILHILTAIYSDGLITNKISVNKILLNSIIVFLIQIILYSILLLILERKYLEFLYNKLNSYNNYSNLNENIYTTNEKNKVYSNQNLTIKIEDLTKTYTSCRKKVRAINQLHLGLEVNEKFGLLGFNGSGKTTTFKSLTNEIFYDRGIIELFKLNNKNNFETIRKNIGYCPQSNALFDYLTVKETFDFYLKLKNHNILSETILEEYGLLKFKNTYARNLSGGNKRKLNFAIALMNYPKIVLLDEPSTGVDPESRRIMWKCINSLPEFNKSYNMILSTHSMEEAEILCDKIGWMKNGNFICIGNPEKLKLQFSEGYYLYIKFKNTVTDENNFDNLENVESINENDVRIHSHLYSKLNDLIGNINKLCDNIKIKDRRDNSFELVINVSPKNQGILFSSLLLLKNDQNDVLEINIHMQSLENILNNL